MNTTYRPHTDTTGEDTDMKERHTDFPGSYDALPIGTYLRVMEACEKNPEEPDTTVAVLAVLTGMDTEEVLDLPLDEFTRLSARAAYLREKAPERKVRERYEAGEFTLVPVADIRKMTAAQYIDFQTFAREGMRRMPEVLSCLLVPDGCRYTEGYDPVEVQDALRTGMCVTDAVALYAFFLDSLRRSILDMSICSAEATLPVLPRERRKALRLLARLKAARLLAGLGWGASTASPRPAAAPGRRSGR